MTADELAKQMIFTDEVVRCIREKVPSIHIHVDEPLHLICNRKHLGLQDLYRTSIFENEDTTPDIIQRFVSILFKNNTLGPIEENRFLNDLRKNIFPRIHSTSIFAHLDRNKAVYAPFINNCVLVYVIDTSQCTTSLVWTEVAKWELTDPLEVLDTIARSNLRQRLARAKVTKLQSPMGYPVLYFKVNDGYDASRLLLRGLHARLSPYFGNKDFFVAIPSRDTFIAIPINGEAVKRAHKALTRLFDTMPYPITNRLFTVTQDGIAGTE